MTSFNSFRFLCCSMPSFGVSITSLKNSLSFNMSPASAIIFIKCRNHHHMKNNIRYKGNTNNTCVIIFFKIEGQKLAAMVLCLGEPPRRFFVVVDLHFIFDLHFVVVLHLSMFFIHICFSTSSLTLPWTIAGFLHPFYTFSPAHRRVIRDTFIFRPFHLAASATVLSGHFLPTGAFCLTLLHRHFNLRLSRLPWEPAVLP